MANTREFRILIVEDDPDDAHLVAGLLAAEERPGFNVCLRTTLAAALVEMDNASPDAVLLDLSLPDSEGFEGLREIGLRHRRVPVVVLTGLSDAGAGIEALGLGAEDYLLKAGLDRNLLVRALRYAQERKSLQCQIEDLREHERAEREQAAYARLLAPSRTSVTAQFYGAVELADSAPQLFGELVQRYGELLERRFSDTVRAGERATSHDLQVMSESIYVCRAPGRDPRPPGCAARVHRNGHRLRRPRHGQRGPPDAGRTDGIPDGVVSPTGHRAQPPPRRSGHEARRQPGKGQLTLPTLVFELFVTGRTRQSQAAIQNLRAYFAEIPEVEYELTIVDVLEQPDRAEERHILATPTLIRLLPMPSLRIIGDLSAREIVWQTIGLLSSGDAPGTTRNIEEPNHD
jgi:DNA-binding response OmpR family regulator